MLNTIFPISFKNRFILHLISSILDKRKPERIRDNQKYREMYVKL